MILNKLEALADALAFYNRAHDPQSAAYQNRNPGQLRSFLLKHPKDAKGYRVFTSYLDGYQALLYDLRLKCSGKSAAKLKADATLKDLLANYRMSGSMVGRYICKYLADALGTEVNEDIVLSFFLE